MIVQCATFPKSLTHRNIDKSVSDTRNQRGPCAGVTQLDSLKTWCPRQWTKPNTNRGHARTDEIPSRE